MCFLCRADVGHVGQRSGGVGIGRLRSVSKRSEGGLRGSGRYARLRLAGGYKTNSVSIHHHPSLISLIVEPLMPGGARRFTQRLRAPFRLLRKDPRLQATAPHPPPFHAPPPTSPSSPPHPPSVQNAHAQVVTAQMQVKIIKRKDNDTQHRHKQTTYRIYNNKNNAFYCFSFPYFLTNHSKRRICIVRGQGESPLSR